jgi:DNA invertase Pin-like site-specific DNA recombinase
VQPSRETFTIIALRPASAPTGRRSTRSLTSYARRDVPRFTGRRRPARPNRRELLKAIAPGDVVMVTRIDRLARSTFDLFAIVKQIVDAKGQFRSLAEPWADTATLHARRSASPGLRLQFRDHASIHVPV